MLHHAHIGSPSSRAVRRGLRFKSQRSQTRLGFEALEDRRVLATVTVNTDVGAPGELRSAIAATPAGGTVDFMLPSGGETITLTMGQLLVNKNLTINGANTSGSGTQVTVNGNNLSRVFAVDDGNGATLATVNFRNLTIRGGSAVQGAGIANTETLRLEGVIVTGNKALQPNAAYTTFGGGILNNGALTLTNSLVSNNTAEFNGATNSAFGAGIASLGVGSSLQLNTSEVTDNESVGGGGGGIFTQLGSLTLVNSLVSRNRAGLDSTLFPNIDRYDYGAGISSYSQGPGNTFAPLNISITNSEISHNVLSSDPIEGAGSVFPYGAGLFARGRGTISIVESCVASNTATGNYGTLASSNVRARGGGMFLYGDDGGPLSVTISKSTISDNFSFREGGGIAVRGRYADDGNPLNDGTVNLSITGTTIENNYARIRGGGVHNSSYGADAQGAANISIVSSKITGNSVAPGTTGGGGGGIANRWGGFMEIDRTTIDGNTAYYGGGIYNASYYLDYIADPEQKSRMIVRNSTISGNVAPVIEGGMGGGLYNLNSYLEMTQSTVSGNSAMTYGGGVYLKQNSYYLGTPYETRTTIDRSTITSNTSTAEGGGIGTDAYSISTWSNSIISGNTGPLGSENVYLTGNTTITYAFDFVNGNAQLGLLTDNGGPTLTHLPMPGSPVINAADLAATGVADQRDFGPRVAGGRMDIGAVETGTQALCDRDGDSDCDIADIDIVIMEIAAGTATLAARDAWLAAAGAENLSCGLPYTLADFNLDGVTDGSDFGIFNANKFTNTGKWSKGDANGDGVTDGTDFGIFNANKFISACGNADCSDPAARTTAPSPGGNLERTPRKSLHAKRDEALYDRRDGVRLPLRQAVEGNTLREGRVRAAAIAASVPAIALPRVRGVTSIANATDDAGAVQLDRPTAVTAPAVTNTRPMRIDSSEASPERNSTVFDTIFGAWDLNESQRDQASKGRRIRSG